MGKLEEIEKDLSSLLLASDDHGHDCTALREYCEQKLIEYSDDQIPWLIERVKVLTNALGTLYKYPDNEFAKDTAERLLTK